MNDKKSTNEPREASQDEGLDMATFFKTADKFIDLANRENQDIQATDLHMAFLFAAARYNAYVANTIMKIDKHEEYIAHMAGQYTEMLRQHLADDHIAREELDS